MKIIAAFILLIVLLAQLGSSYVMMVTYELNKNYISKMLCVNRDKPVSRCKGKCYLKKQLDKAAKEENGLNTKIKADKNEPLFLIPAKKITIPFFAETNSGKYVNTSQAFTPQNLYSTVFHPPEPE